MTARSLGLAPSSVLPEDQPKLLDHLRILSADTTKHSLSTSSPYHYHESAGKGITQIFVGTGLNISAADLSSAHRRVRYWVVPTKDMLKKVKYQSAFPETIDDVTGHGTCVVSAAAGVTFGSAYQSDVYSIKSRTGYFDASGKQIIPVGYTISALRATFRHIVKLINRETSLRGKAVVCLTFGFRSRDRQEITEGSEAFVVFDEFIQSMWKNDVVTVTSAGNNGIKNPKHLGDYLPQRLGTPENALITVGCIDSHGNRWPGTTPEGARVPQSSSEMPGAYPGSITVSALGDHVGVEGRSKILMVAGTSYAAPQVSGLAACLLAHPNAPKFAPGTVAKGIKDLILDLSWEWTPGVPAANNRAHPA